MSPPKPSLLLLYGSLIAATVILGVCFALLVTSGRHSKDTLKHDIDDPSRSVAPQIEPGGEVSSSRQRARLRRESRSPGSPGSPSSIDSRSIPTQLAAAKNEPTSGSPLTRLVSTLGAGITGLFGSSSSEHAEDKSTPVVTSQNRGFSWGTSGNPETRASGTEALTPASSVPRKSTTTTPNQTTTSTNDDSPSTAATSSTSGSPSPPNTTATVDSCDACEREHCPVPLAACVSNECWDLVECIQTSQCANQQDKLARCYCGDQGTLDDCFFNGATPTGPCADLIASGAETDVPLQIGARFMDSHFLTGQATQLVLCDMRSCSAQCL